MSEILKLPMPENLPRAEDGIIQFGIDWPAIHLRGDSALTFAFYLEQYLNGSKESEPYLRSMVNLLRSCHMKNIK